MKMTNMSDSSDKKQDSNSIDGNDSNENDKQQAASKHLLGCSCNCTAEASRQG